MQHTLKILVLCTGNSCRSQMAEGFFRHHGGSSLKIRSAGLNPKGVHPNAVRVMAEVGLDISSHRSKPVGDFVDEPFDFVITVCDNAAANCPVFTGAGEKMHWPFDDPDAATGTENEILAEFRRVRDEIDARVTKWLEERRG